MAEVKSFRQLANLEAAKHTSEAHRLKEEASWSARKALLAIGEFDFITAFAAVEDCCVAKLDARREEKFAEVVMEIRDNPRG